MTKLADAIGPTFGREMIAANLSTTPVCWTPEGEFFNLEMLQPWQQAELDKVIAAHDPAAQLQPETALGDHEVRITALETSIAAMKTQLDALSSKRGKKE